MTSPAFIIVGRVRKAHGIRGELVVEVITDAPDAVFAPGHRVFAGTASGDISTSRTELHITTSRPFNEGLLVGFAEIPERNAAEMWRGRYLLLPDGELPPPDENEVYLHDLLGMRVELPTEEVVGTVEELYELPQGLALDVRRAEPRASETVLVLYDDNTIASVDKEKRVIVITPPEGLLE
ncbi:MAG: Ribosome maturation factor rimM [Gemmatimonadetes bacterium]|jgi:16S rRNA processing protein RimM|nr:Ribosome maturation factor rimM [Gemmatimonadota bacterium]